MTSQTNRTTIFGISAAGLAVIAGMLGLVCIGLFVLNAIDQAEMREIAANNLFKKQATWVALGFILMLIVRAINYQKISTWSYFIFIFMLILLASVLVFGIIGEHYLPFLKKYFPNKNGSYRWIDLQFGQIQPSEFIKIAYILGLSRYLRYRKNFRTFAGLLGPFVLTLIATVLILLEPDLGTAILLLPVLFIMLYSAGAKIKHLAAIFMLMVMSVPLLFTQLHGYQRQEIAGVLLQSKSSRQWIKDRPKLKQILYQDKSLDEWHRNREGFQLNHSKIAMGSGGLFGFGLGNGPYIDGKCYLPECHNDFIFAIIGHQTGFVGTVGVVLLYLVIAIGLVEIAAKIEEPFGRLLVVGILAMLLTQAGINMAMTMGLTPITGVTLPFISYGGSSILTYFILIGLALSVDKARPINMGPKPFEFSEED